MGLTAEKPIDLESGRERGAERRPFPALCFSSKLKVSRVCVYAFCREGSLIVATWLYEVWAETGIQTFP